MAKRRNIADFMASDGAHYASPPAESKQQPAPVSDSAPPVTYQTPEPQAHLSMNLKTADAVQKPLFSIQTLERNVSNCLRILDDKVLHAYVTRLDELPVKAPDLSDFDSEALKNEPYQFFHITRLVYEQDEFSVSKLAAVFQTLSGKHCTLVLLVHNEKHVTKFYLGVRDHDKKDFTSIMRKMLETSLKGQFPGTDIDKEFMNENMDDLMEALSDTTHAVSSVSCIPDFKQSKEFLDNEDFLQGLEKFVISMQDKDYAALFVADAVPYDVLTAYRTELESVCTQLSPFANMQFQVGTSDGSSHAGTEQSGRTDTTTEGTSESMGKNASMSHGTQTGETDTEGITWTHGTNSSTSDSTSHGETVTDGTNESQTHSDSVTKTKTGGANLGLNIGEEGIGGGMGVFGSLSKAEGTTDTATEGTSHSVGLSDTISKTLTSGISDSTAVNTSKSKNRGTNETETFGTSTQYGTNSAYSTSFNFGHAETITNTFGTSQGVMLQSQNLMIVNMMERIKKQIKRIDECESVGMWNCAAYFLSNTLAISERAASTYRSLISGENTGVERSAVNTWTAPETVSVLKDYLTNYCHPKFEYGTDYVSAASLLSTNELAIEMGLPRKSVNGLPVIEHAVFGQQIVTNDVIGTCEDGPCITLGNIYHLNTKTDVPVTLDTKSLTMHMFVTGSTGAGKSNAVYHILDELSRCDRLPRYDDNENDNEDNDNSDNQAENENKPSEKVKYLVIEPAKGEYKNHFTDVPVYQTTPGHGEMLKLNPFSFPSEVHIQEHIDRLAELFNVCWPMYAAMPAVLKDAIIRAYESAGWDMNRSENTVDARLFPNFADVLREIDVVVRKSDYSRDTSSDYKGSLKTRLRSLTNGINGIVFSGREIPPEELFDENAIVDLSHVGASETKSLIMGVLVLKLQEYRMSQKIEADSGLRHVTVLEEAHNLLRKTSTEQGQESANVQGKSVEMLTNSIAEMRTYGEGFIIVDQAPNLLDTAVIRNTNTKLIMRLPEGTDREITGRSIALDEKQMHELSKLPQGVAAVYQNNWQEAVLCKLKKYTSLPAQKQAEVSKDTYDEKKTLKRLLESKKMTDELHESIRRSDAPAKVRKTLLQHFERQDNLFEWAMACYITNRFSWKRMLEGIHFAGNTTETLGTNMMENLKEIFPEFSLEELGRIGYYICRANPNSEIMKSVRVEYFQKYLKKECYV